jgi:hypothetical protein
MTSNDLKSTLEKVSRIITDRYGLRLVCEGDACKTDGRTIYLPSLPENMPDWLLGPIRGWADHECAHAIFTETELGPVFRQAHGPQAFGILNVLEDVRVEALMARRYLTAAKSGPADAVFPDEPLVNNGLGKVPGMEWNSGGHTNSLVPFFAKGHGMNRFMQHIAGEDPVRGPYIDNTASAEVIFELLE